MIRLLLRLIGIKDFEVCQSCETLKQQLEFERAEKKQLTETLINILQPKVVETPSVTEIQPIINSGGIFSRRRAALEERDRLEAAIKKQSPNVARPDNVVKTVESLEKELGIEEETAENG